MTAASAPLAAIGLASHQLDEYACHEGSHALEDVLRLGDLPNRSK
jgi:hypothetical protein